MSKKDVSPSVGTITLGQVAKFIDLQTAKLRKSGLPCEPTQYVLEHEGAEIADAFLADVTRRVEARIRVTEPHILMRLPFDPEKFIGKGWEVDERIGQRTGNNLDAGSIVRKDYLKKGESYINGEERLKRIKAAGEQDLQLDDQDFLALWQEKSHKTLNWLYETKGITWLSFWGLVLQNPHGSRHVLCLYRNDDGSWDWLYYWLDVDDWRASPPSAVLAS